MEEGKRRRTELTRRAGLEKQEEKDRDTWTAVERFRSSPFIRSHEGSKGGKRAKEPKLSDVNILEDAEGDYSRKLGFDA